MDYLYLYDDGSGASGSYINEGATHSRTGRNATGFDRGATSATVINRAGAVLTVDQANANAAFRMEPTFTNLGQVNLTRGTLALGDVTDPPAGQTPGTYDVSSGATLRVNGGNLSVNPGTITGTGALLLNGGFLTAPTTAPGATLNNLTVNSGGVTGNLTVTSLIANGGSFYGSGQLTLPTGTAPQILSTQIYDAYRIVNQGDAQVGYIFLDDAGTGSTPSYINEGVTRTRAGTDATGFDRGSPMASVINRAGATLTVNQANANAAFRVEPTFTNLGQVNVTKGVLALGDVTDPPAGQTPGTYDVSSGATLRVNGGNLSVNPGTVTGTGVLSLNGGTLTAPAAAPGVTLNNLQANGGTVTGHLTVNNFYGGNTTFSGASQLTLPAGTTPVLDSVYLLGGYTILNQGDAQINYLYLYDDGNGTSGSYINEGTTRTKTGTDAYGFQGNGSPSASVINRAGAVLTVNQANATGTFRIEPTFTNLGQVNVIKGTLVQSSVAGLSNTGVLSGTGLWAATSGNIRFPVAIKRNEAQLAVGSTGNIQTLSGTAGLAALAINTGTVSFAKSQTISTALANSGALNVTGGTLQPTTYTQTAGTTTISSGASLRGGSSGSAAVVIDGGTLTGAGGIVAPLSGNGTFAPGGQGGPLAVTGSWSPGGSSTTRIALSGSATPGTDFGKITVTGTASLSGSLTFVPAGGYLPAVGTTYRIIDAGSRVGTFSSITGENLPNNTYLEPSYDATGVTVTVRADPTLSVGDATVAEGNSGTGTVSVPITLSSTSSRAVSVDYTTVAQSGTAGDDFVSTSGTVTFAPGETTKSVSVTVNGDTFFEPDETFGVRLSNPVRTTIARADGVVTITNDDSAPSIPTVTAVSPSTVGQGVTNRQLTITGTQFDPQTTVAFSRPGITIVAGSLSVVSSTTITLRATVSSSMAAGPVDVSASNANGSASCGGCLNVTPKAVATSVTPALGQGAKLREVVITGTDFQPGVTVKTAAGTVASTSYVDSTTVEAWVTIAATKAAGSYSVTATNPDGGVSVCATCMTVVAGPQLTSMSPSAAGRGSTVTVTLTGSGIVRGAKLSGPVGVTFDAVNVVNATTITATMTVAGTAKVAANQIVTVTNPGSAGYGVSTKALLTITA